MKKRINLIITITILFTTIYINTSCNVTRVLTNESQYFQKGDTCITIQTKTIETYNAKKL